MVLQETSSVNGQSLADGNDIRDNNYGMKHNFSSDDMVRDKEIGYLRRGFLKENCNSGEESESEDQREKPQKLMLTTEEEVGEETETEEDTLVPDGGWGWIVCLGKLCYIRALKSYYGFIECFMWSVDVAMQSVSCFTNAIS